MRVTDILQQFFNLVRDPPEEPSERVTEQHDKSSMADFVRILRDHDGEKAS